MNDWSVCTFVYDYSAVTINMDDGLQLPSGFAIG